MKLLLSFLLSFFSLQLIAQDPDSVGTSLSKRERKEQDNYIKNNLVGKWKDQNSTISFFPNSRFLIVFDSIGIEQKGFWEIRKGKLILTEHPSYVETVYKISSFSTSKMEYQETGRNTDPTIWIARKIAHFK